MELTYTHSYSNTHTHTRTHTNTHTHTFSFTQTQSLSNLLTFLALARVKFTLQYVNPNYGKTLNRVIFRVLLARMIF